MSQTAARPRSLSVVVPAYNEETRLSATVDAMAAYLRDRSVDGEILVVDDGSRDGTRAVAEALSRRWPCVRVLGYTPNRGKGHAVRTGILAAGKDTILCSDADHSMPIENVDRFWPWLDGGYDVVIGSRRMSDSDPLVPQPLYRRSMGRLFGIFISLFAIRGFRDTQCGFKLFRGEAARALFGRLRTEGFAFEVEILLRARAMGYRVREVGVRWTHFPNSSVHTWSDGARMGLAVFRMRRFL